MLPKQSVDLLMWKREARYSVWKFAVYLEGIFTYIQHISVQRQSTWSPKRRGAEKYDKGDDIRYAPNSA